MVQWPHDLGRDLRLGMRAALASPVFSGAAVVTLALGIGIAAAMLTIFDAVLRRPLPVREQDRLVVLWGGAEGSIRQLPLTGEHFTRYRREVLTLDAVAGAVSGGGWPHAVVDRERVLPLNVGFVTGNFFDVLGAVPSSGRFLRPGDDEVGAAPAAVISQRVWESHFNADPQILGRRLTLPERGETYTIVGVAPRGLDYPTATDLWVPLVARGMWEVVPLGRLRAEATPAQAAAELAGSFRRDPSSVRDRVEARAHTLSEVVVGDVRPAVVLLSSASALLLLIACLNVANLLLVRLSGRGQEIAVRRALGAGRGRLIRQLSIEHSLLVSAGGLFGAALAFGLVRALIALAPPELPRLDEIAATAPPLTAVLVVTLIALLFCGILPALWITSRPDVAPTTSERRVTESTGARRLQHALVALQIALAVVVLAGAGLLGRSLRELERQHLGFRADRLTVVHLAWPLERFDGPDRVNAFYDRLLPRLSALPEVVAVAPVNVGPFTGAGGGWDGWFVAEGSEAVDASAAPVFNMAAVGSGYFQALDLPILGGRAFSDADRNGSPNVVILSEAAARVLWPGENPLGRRVSMGPPESADDWRTVVGVVPETRYRALRDPTPTVYVPYRQMGAAVTMIRTLALRTRHDAGASMSALRRAVQDVDPAVDVMRADSLQGLLAHQLAQPRLNALLSGVFAATALVLAAVGLYAVLAYVVRRRTRELAIRHALGATPSQLRRLVLRQALFVSALGLVGGLGAALATGRFAAALLYRVSPADPFTLAGVAVTLLSVATAAAYIPSRRAMRVDPAIVLHEG